MEAKNNVDIFKPALFGLFKLDTASLSLLEVFI